MYKIPANMLTPPLKKELANAIADDRRRGCKWSEIAAKSPVSLTTSWQWTQRDMSIEAQASRQDHPRNPGLLSSDERCEVLTRASSTRKKFVPISQQWTRNAVADITKGRVVKPSNGWIIRFYKSEGWHSCRI